MLYIISMIESILYILIFILSILIGVAYLTVAERKTMGYMQRRLGPNSVGYYGILMAIADALKLLMKEIVIVNTGNKIYILIGPLITLFSVLISFSFIPLNPSSSILDSEYNILLILSIGSIGVLGTIIVGWMSNSKYTLLGSIRSISQLLSYELILTTTIFIIVLLNNDLNILNIINNQYYVFNIIALFPLSLIFFISILAETSRPPFDNVEAESELVSGHMTELSAAPFVLFFLSEYSSMLVMSLLTSILFIGGYLSITASHYLISSNFLIALLYTSNLMLKTSIFLFTFIWVRASFPRLRFDLLILFSWYTLLPLLFAYCITLPTILYTF